MLDEASVEQFRVSLCGELIQPGDEGYDESENGGGRQHDEILARPVPACGFRNPVFD